MKWWVLGVLLALVAGALGGFAAALMTSHASWGPAAWAALAAWVTAVIAAIAGSVAWTQLREARRLRIEQAQPYAIAYMESSSALPQFVDLVIKNFGATAAIDVRVSATPALERSTQQPSVESVWVPEVIPVLAPGQEWRTLWDFSPERAQVEALADRHEMKIAFSDSSGRLLHSSAILDWSAFRGRRWVGVQTIHDAAKALKALSRTAAKCQESIHGGLAVYVRDGNVKDAAEQARYEQFLKAGEASRGANATDDNSRSDG